MSVYKKKVTRSCSWKIEFWVFKNALLISLKRLTKRTFKWSISNKIDNGHPGVTILLAFRCFLIGFVAQSSTFKNWIVGLYIYIYMFSFGQISCINRILLLIRYINLCFTYSFVKKNWNLNVLHMRWSSWSFAWMEGIRRICNLMVDRFVILCI